MSGDEVYETIRAWQHLSLSEIIPGSYNGLAVSANPRSDLTNSPASSISGAGYKFGYTSTGIFGKVGNRVSLGAEGNNFNLAALSAADAQSIDSKMDDGIADTGKVFGRDGFTVTGCNTNPGTDESYGLSTQGIVCRMDFFFD